MKCNHFQNRKPNREKLLANGFSECGGNYTYCSEIADGQMLLSVTVSPGGEVCTAVTDNLTGEDYILHQTPAEGAFVGKVRQECDDVLQRIAALCFDPEVFKSRQTKEVIAYVRATYGDEPEFLWQKFPDNAVWRRKDTQTWYGALLTVPARKIGLPSDEKIEILDLRILPEEMSRTVDGVRFFPGWHMNKKYWYTVCLNGTVSTDALCRRIDESYRLAKK